VPSDFMCDLDFTLGERSSPSQPQHMRSLFRHEAVSAPGTYTHT